MTTDDDQGAPPPPPRPGASTFTIEGRAAPGLFVVGWLASILGLALTVTGALAGSALFVFFIGPGLLSVGLIAGAGNQALERRARGAAYAGPSPVLVFAAIIAVTYLLGALIGVVLGGLLGATAAEVSAPIRQFVAGALIAAISVGVIRVVVIGTGALTWAGMGIRRFDRQAARDAAFGASLALPVIGVTLVVGGILVAIFGVIAPSPLPPTGELSGLVLQLLVGAGIAPVAEEIVFRGFAVTAWRRSLGPAKAIVRASVLFALAHVVGIEATTFGEAIGLICVGVGTRLPVALVLGWIFVGRRSIWAPIGLHAAFNATLLILADLAFRAGAG
jgi:hypothetical protein